jgi:hypothetical protein
MALLSNYAPRLDFSGTKLFTSNKYPQTASNASYNVAFNPAKWEWTNKTMPDGTLKKPSDVMAGFTNPQFLGPMPVVNLAASLFQQPTIGLKEYVNVDPANQPPPIVNYKPLTKKQQKMVNKGKLVLTGHDVNGNPQLSVPGSATPLAHAVRTGFRTAPGIPPINMPGYGV